MPVNPANFNVGPQALRRYEQKRRWRQPYQFDQGSGQAVTYQTGLLVQLVRRPRAIGTKVSYKLQAPQVVTSSQPPVVTGPLGALVLQVPRRPVHYKLSPPVVVTPASQPPVVTTLRVSLAKQRLRVGTISTLGAPVVVNPPPPVVTTLRVTLAPSPRQGRWSGYGLAPPAIVDISPAPPLRVSLAQQKLNRRKTLSALRPPTVVGQAVVPVAPFAPVRVTLAKWRRPRPTIHQLRIGLTATPTHDCRKPLLIETTQADGTLTEASATRGSLSLGSHSGGTLTDSGGAHGALTESSSAKGNLTDNC